MVNDDGEFACAWEDLVDGYDCSQLWPTTTTTTEEPGCCYGDSYKANSKCLASTDQERCESRGCNWMVTDDPDDCLITTTNTPTTTEEPGCCYGEGVKENEMCATKIGRDQCERSGTCEFRSGDDADCTYTPTTTTAEPGCCYGDSYKANDKCEKAIEQEQCEMKGCAWMETDDPSDCEMTTTE